MSYIVKGWMKDEGFLLLPILALFEFFLVSSLSHFHSLSHKFLLRSRAHESFSKAQSLELLLREAATPRPGRQDLVR